jgi:hypothetical protein
MDESTAIGLLGSVPFMLIAWALRAARHCGGEAWRLAGFLGAQDAGGGREWSLEEIFLGTLAIEPRQW